MGNSIQDEYYEKIIKPGDRGSDLLTEAIAKTIGNSEFARIEGNPYQLTGLRIPAGQCVVVNSDVGEGSTLASKARSLVERLSHNAIDELGARPIAFTNIIDSTTGDDSVILPIRDTLVSVANEKRLAIINGENAILGSRVVGDSSYGKFAEKINGSANISGTMFSIVEPDELFRRGITNANGIYRSKNGTAFILFPSTGEFLFANSDGVGTKHEFYERLGVDSWIKANRDAIAMDADDAGKNAARIIAYSGVCERNLAAKDIGGIVPAEMSGLCQKLGFFGTLELRIGNYQSYKEGIPAFNIGGSAISIIPDVRLTNLPVPKEGNYLVVLRSRIPNPRSNGITAKREGMEKLHGKEWQETPWGKYFMQFLAQPSTIFYPFFMEVFDKGLADSVYHMSGGAFDGKLARPLAKQGLYVELDNLFEADPREIALASVTSNSIAASYGKCSMSNEAFIATDYPHEVIDRAIRRGYDARKAGRIERNPDGKTGVKFYALGQEVSFSGKK